MAEPRGERQEGDVAKRTLDIALAGLALVAFAPVIGIVAALVRLRLGTPVVFRQERPGVGARPFVLYKFRSMVDASDPSGQPLPDAQRLTPFGRFLRASSLDELPTLWNVLRGDMSLVGPRPLLMRYVPYFTDRERLRFQVRPGVTGWAQVHGRNELPWDTRLEYDAWYVENRSFRLDLRILARTARAVFGRRGVVVDARSIMLNLDEERADRRRAAEGAARHDP